MATPKYVQGFLDQMKTYGIKPSTIYQQKYKAGGLGKPTVDLVDSGMKGWLFAIVPAVGDSDRLCILVTQDGKLWRGDVNPPRELPGTKYRKPCKGKFLNIPQSPPEKGPYSPTKLQGSRFQQNLDYRVQRLVSAGNAIGSSWEIDPYTYCSNKERANHQKAQNDLDKIRQKEHKSKRWF